MIIPRTLILQLQGCDGSPLRSLKAPHGFIALLSLFRPCSLGSTVGAEEHSPIDTVFGPVHQAEPTHRHLWAPRYQPVASKMGSGERNNTVWDSSFRLLWPARRALVYLAFWLIFPRLKRLDELLLSKQKLQAFCCLVLSVFPSTPQVLSGSCVVSKKKPRSAKFTVFFSDSMFNTVLETQKWQESAKFPS